VVIKPAKAMDGNAGRVKRASTVIQLPFNKIRVHINSCRDSGTAYFELVAFVIGETNPVIVIPDSWRAIRNRTARRMR
jgi:hypothetical protein